MKKLFIRNRIKKWIFWKLFQKEITVANELVQIQQLNGNWNYDPYMHGMANGMILIEHVFHADTTEPKYLTAPKEWLVNLLITVQ